MKTLCKVCFKEFSSIFSKTICHKCFNKLEVVSSPFSYKEVKGTILYKYNDSFKTLLYLYKACYDYELKDVFLERFILELKIRYRNYYIVIVPSNEEDDKKRGYSHLEEIFSCLKLKIITPIYKNKYFKQSERSKKLREGVINDFSIVENNDIEGRKILLVDDVLTTGSSIKACIELLKRYNPQKIRVLILSKKVK